MRLLSTSTIRLKLFNDNQVPDYVILSHRWEDEEVEFQDLSDGTAESKIGWSKIVNTCDQAKRDGYEWVWIDSCCIDKTSSAELSEAINSMWQWYQRSNICYAYLSDVEDIEDESRFLKSKWWTRGWTLQELLAPVSVEFYSKDWSLLGTRLNRLGEISVATGIDPQALGLGRIRHCNAAQKMSWVRHRECTRSEDLAYCLLGLFDVNMPLLYGEGATKAFERLQVEILRRETDESLFLYANCPRDSHTTLLAMYPWQFCRLKGCARCDEKNIITCLDPAVDYGSLESTPYEISLKSVNADLTISSGGLRGTFKALTLDSVRTLPAEAKDPNISVVILLDVLESEDMVFALPVGRKPSHIYPDEDMVYRIAGRPLIFPKDDIPFTPKRLEILDPWWVTAENHTQVTWEVASLDFEIIGSLHRQGEGERSTVRREDKKIILTSSGFTEGNRISWIVSSDYHDCAFYFSVTILPLKGTTFSLLMVREPKSREVTEMAMHKESTLSDNWGNKIYEELRDMTFAEHCNFKLRDGRKFEIRTRRVPASRSTHTGLDINIMHFRTSINRV